MIGPIGLISNKVDIQYVPKDVSLLVLHLTGDKCLTCLLAELILATAKGRLCLDGGVRRIFLKRHIAIDVKKNIYIYIDMPLFLSPPLCFVNRIKCSVSP